MNMILGNGDKFGLPYIWHNIYSLDYISSLFYSAEFDPQIEHFAYITIWAKINSQDYTFLLDKKTCEIVSNYNFLDQLAAFLEEIHGTVEKFQIDVTNLISTLARVKALKNNGHKRNFVRPGIL